MATENKTIKIICLFLGSVFLLMAFWGVAKDKRSAKFYGEVSKVSSSFTSTRDVRAGNDGGRDSYLVYGEVVEVYAIESAETREISVTRREKSDLPKEGDRIMLKMTPDGVWEEADKRLFNLGTAFLVGFGGLLIAVGLTRRRIGS